MENYALILVLLGVMTILSTLAEKIKVSSPIVLILAGIAIGFVPEMPAIEIESEIVFLLFLPPLLYDAAFKIHWPAFKQNIYIISRLAFSLVFITTVGIAAVAYYLIPAMSWPLAFVLGAILAPTDAVAALNITKGMKLSSLTNTVLEGESLLNDASALVAFKFALAALFGSAFVFWEASLSFFTLLIGGFLVGFLSSKLLSLLLKLIRDNGTAVLSLTLLSPFVVYLIAEHFHASGVIAVVTLAFGLSRVSATRFPETLKKQSEHIWDMITFLLNGLIFILIGLELPIVVKKLTVDQLLMYGGYGAIITVVALLLRTLSVFLHRKRLQRAFHSAKSSKRGRVIPASILLSVQESFIISWSGMRGIISLALAIGLPHTLKSGEPFPFKNDIIYITTVVVLLTIVGQGLFLPRIAKSKAQS